MPCAIDRGRCSAGVKPAHAPALHSPCCPPQAEEYEGKYSQAMHTVNSLRAAVMDMFNRTGCARRNKQDGAPLVGWAFKRGAGPAMQHALRSPPLRHCTC